MTLAHQFRVHLPYLLIIWLLPLSVYLYTKAPSILYIDAGTIVAAAYEPGIPNPPGFPFYVMVAHLFTKIPFGEILFRVQLLSIVSAVGILTLVYLNLFRLIKNDFVFVSGSKGDNLLFGRSFLKIKSFKNLPDRLIKIVAVSASLILAFSYQFWSQSINSESYVFTNFLMMSLLTIALTTAFNPKSLNKRTIFAASLMGLSTGANPTVVQVAPALILTTFFFWKFIGTKRLIVMIILLAIFNLAVYSYLPLRAKGYPFLNWGNPQTFELFVGHLRGQGLDIYDPRTNSINGFTGSPQIMAQSFGRYLYLFFLQFTPILTPLIFLGGYYLFKKNLKLFLTLIVIPLTNMIFGTLYLSGNQESWFIASYVIFSMLIGVGLMFLIKLLLSFKIKYQKFAPFLPLALVLIPAIWYFPKLDRSKFVVTKEYADNLYENLLPNAVLIGSGDFFNQLTHYEYGVVKKRGDVFPVVANMWYILPWYRDNLRHHQPELVPKGLEGMIKKDRLEEYNEVMNWWIRYLIDKGVPVYVTPMVFRESVLAGTSAGKYVVDKAKLKAINNGLVYRLLTEKDLLQPDEEYFKYKFKDPKFYLKPPFYLERNYNAAFGLILKEYGASFLGMADYFMNLGNKDKELEYLKYAYEVAPHSAEIVNRLGIYGISVGDIKAAAKYFQEASEVDPRSFEVKLNLARSLISLGKIEEGKRNLQLIIDKSENPELIEEARQEFSKLSLKQLAETVPLNWKEKVVSYQKFSFKYPDDFTLSTTPQGTTVVSYPQDNFSISFYGGLLLDGQDSKKWLKLSPIRFSGKQEQQGKAQIPTFEADAAFWVEDGVKALEFILVQNKHILHMKIEPADGRMVQRLDQILSTIKFID